MKKEQAEPKNIVLLSDGTGNSSGKLLKTNVWRVYESLLLTDPSKQVACYDDGVGTSSFKPLALLGGAVGIGLSRNVLRLYRFLCEYYNPGDRIFLFGFSRGAFTVRVLAGFICDQGIIKTRPTRHVAGATITPNVNASSADGTRATADEDFAYGSELNRLTHRAYREFRKNFKQTGWRVKAARSLRDFVVSKFDRVLGRKPYDKKRNYLVSNDVEDPVYKIAFIGVWDTVDAYGLPIDELTHGIDQWVWPLSMPDLNLNEKVKRACHVLALDDERNTFHPVLWDEEGSGQPQNCTHINDERITQVWFAGMHSNVGGGYPDDVLSAVSLAWMFKQLHTTELLFVEAMLKHHTAKADPLGRRYDSRSGLKGYYRYNPRRIELLTNGQPYEQRWTKGSLKVCVGRPKIHESVFTRMSAAPEAYAPIVLPKTYAVVMEEGDIRDGNENPYEPSAAAERRVAAQEEVWDLVWLRRILYFAAVGWTLAVLALPFLDRAIVARSSPDAGIPGRIVATLGEWLPSFASPWIEYFTAKPWKLFAGILILYGLSRIGRLLQAMICDRMRSIWLKVIPPAEGEYEALEPHTGPLMTFRSSRLYQRLYAWWRIIALPFIAGFPTLVCLAFILVWLAGRAPFEVASAMGWTCLGGATDGLSVGESSGPLMLATHDFCNRTGVRLEAGKHYEFRIAITPGANERWQDDDVHVVYSAEGFTSRTPGLTFGQRILFKVATPFRRVLNADWFVPVARIGEMGVTQYRLDASTSKITAKTTGELFLFVNDFIVPWDWNRCYLNNRGAATVTVRRLEDAP